MQKIIEDFDRFLDAEKAVYVNAAPENFELFLTEYIPETSENKEHENERIRGL